MNVSSLSISRRVLVLARTYIQPIHPRSKGPAPLTQLMHLPGRRGTSWISSITQFVHLPDRSSCVHLDWILWYLGGLSRVQQWPLGRSNIRVLGLSSLAANILASGFLASLLLPSVEESPGPCGNGNGSNAADNPAHDGTDGSRALVVSTTACSSVPSTVTITIPIRRCSARFNIFVAAAGPRGCSSDSCAKEPVAPRRRGSRKRRLE